MPLLSGICNKNGYFGKGVSAIRFGSSREFSLP